MSECIDSRATTPHARPLVTVVVPTRGERGQWLRACLDSIVGQGSLVRCVVVGPESDQLAALCDERDIRLVPERGRGMANAVNQGLVQADTPYVSWLGDDDLLSVGSLHLTSNALAKYSDATLAFGQCRVIDGKGGRLWTMRPGRIAVPLTRFVTQMVPQPGSLIRTDSLQKVGLLDPNLRNPMDLDLFLRLRREGPFVYVRQVVSAFRIHDASLTSTNPNPGEEARSVRKRYLSPRAADWSERLSPGLRFAAKAVARAQMLDPRSDRAEFND